MIHEPEKRARKLLLLSVGYGKGHHSAAAALAEYYGSYGWQSQVVDICEAAQPRLFRLSQLFYSFCVRRAPWLWGVTYRLTDAADWALLIHSPLLRPVVRYLRKLLQAEKPDLIICTYPLFAYMLDELRARGAMDVPYVVVVTDAREISRPWVCSSAPLVTVPDAGSRHLILERYAKASNSIVDAGFPVRRAFAPSSARKTPTKDGLRILYGAYRQIGGIFSDVASLLHEFPALHLTVLGGRHTGRIRKVFEDYCAAGRLVVISETPHMAQILPESHLYIGKAGASTMFECYASCVPMLVNFLLPGQEEGNLELLLEDGAGCHVASTAHMIDTIRCLLAHGAKEWECMRRNMIAAGRQKGAACVYAAIEEALNV